MHYLLAAVAAIAIAALLWRALGVQRVGVRSTKPAVAPDDDPEFLRKLGEQQRKKREEDA